MIGKEDNMNRKQRRAVQYGRKTEGVDLKDPEQAQELLENLPVATLVAGVNNSLNILRRRGISIKDWDIKSRELYSLKVFGSRVYFLATESDQAGQIK